jgi:hypothetical protein
LCFPRRLEKVDATAAARGKELDINVMESEMTDKDAEAPADFGPLRRALDASLEYYGVVAGAPDLGTWQLTVEDAAALTAIDMCESGELTADGPEPESYDWRDLKLRSALAKHCREFEARLTSAIDGRTLATTSIRRSFDEKLDIHGTLIKFEDLRDWLREHGYAAGEVFAEYEKQELDICAEAIDEIYLLRVLHQEGKRHLPMALNYADKLGEGGIEDLRTAVRELVVENNRLKQELAATETKDSPRDNRSLSLRERRTMLNIIAALLDVINGRAPGVDAHPEFESEARLIEYLDEKYQGFYGLSSSNLQRKFPEAKRSLQRG